MNLDNALGHLGAYLSGGDELGLVSEDDAGEAYSVIYDAVATMRRQLAEVPVGPAAEDDTDPEDALLVESGLLAELMAEVDAGEVDEINFFTWLELSSKVDELATERDNLMQLVGELRTILRTPEDVDVREHARQVTAKAAKWDAVPWGAVENLLVDWQLGHYANEDDVVDLLAWYDANKPDGAI